MKSNKKSSHTFSSFTWFGQLLILSAIIFLSTTAFTHIGEEPLATSKIGSLAEDVRKNEVLAWRLNHNFDHYGEGSIIRADPGNPQFLILASNKTFIAFDAHEKREGKWEADYSNNKITFYCDEINGEKLTQKPLEYYFLVKDYDESALKLTWQGRHGSVDMIYYPVSKTVRGEVSLRNM